METPVVNPKLQEQLQSSKSQLIPGQMPQQVNSQKKNQIQQTSIPTILTKEKAFQASESDIYAGKHHFNTNYQDDVREARYKNVTNPKVIDPLIFKDPVDRGAAITARAQRIINNPKFKALNDKIYDDYSVNTKAEGLVEKGNLTIWNRPRVDNSDGSHSSEYSISFADDKGREVLVPTVVNGKFLTSDGKKPPEGSAAEKQMFKAAWQHYLKTGENLGKFSSPDAADKYAFNLHNRGDKPKDVDRQAMLLSNYYDKYVAKGYHEMGFDAPDKKIWLEQIRKGKATIDDYFPSTNQKQLGNLVAGAESASGELFKGIVMAGTYMDKVSAHTILGLGTIFPSTIIQNKSKWTISVADKAYANREENYKKNSLGQFSEDMQNNALFWMQTHPSKGIVGKIDSFVGENLIQLPLYEGIGGARKLLLTETAKSAGFKAGTDLLANGMPKLTNLTKTLISSKVGQFAAKRLGEASDGFIGATLNNQTNKEKLITMASWMGFGAASDGLLSLGGMAVKKFISQTAAIGGKPLVDAVITQAAHEVDNLAEPPIANGMTRLYHGSALHGRYDGDAFFSTDKKYARDYRRDAELQYVDVPTDKLNEELDPDGNGYYSKTTLQLHSDQTGLRKPLHTAESVVSDFKQQHSEDPVKAQLLLGAKAVIHDTAMTIHNVPWQELGPTQKKLVMEKLGLTTQDAINETVIHNSEIVQQHVENNLAEEFKDNPTLKSDVDIFQKKFGIKVSSAVVEAEKAQVEASTGIKNSQAAIEKIEKANRKPVNEEDKELAPRQYVSFKVASLAYFKNPVAKKEGTNLADFLEDMDSKDFIQELRDNVGNFPQFEKPEHLLTWAWKYRDEMPKEFRHRIEDELHEIRGGSPNIWDKEAKNMEAHLQKLADSGRLNSEKNVFASSNFRSWRNKTSWQKDLDLEQEESELALIKKGFRRFPDAAANAESIVRNLQEIRAKATSAHRDLQVTDNISKTTTSLLEKAKAEAKAKKAAKEQ